ncbi:MAG TPA: NAD-glutamate dehydrogenase, partial [Microthrixaceae bacterium]|nr:NAD-glutamate dehydrogenase [Microthrixaceae bacterium]
LVERAIGLARDRAGAEGPDPDECGRLIHAFYRHVAPEDVIGRSETDLYGAALSQQILAADRPQGRALLRVFTPTVAEHGWSAQGHTVVEVVTDDMPFLVDSVTMALTAGGHDVHVVVHPQMLVRREVTGTLVDLVSEEDAARSDGGAAAVEVRAAAAGHHLLRESWMHIEIDRESDAGDLADIENALHKVLTDVREAVEDWERMRERALAVVEELETDPPPLPEEEITEGAALLRWLADDHFTFLGYREYVLDEEGGEEVLRAVPGTGFGILRADPELAVPLSALPEPVRAKAREKVLLVLAKANSRATVHRPVYLDYVGVKVFDADGEVVGERRFLGLFSSAAYTESLTRIPVVRAKAREVIARAGFPAASHSGKALMDVLETYPRDELFHTPVEELAETAMQVLHTRDRRQVRLFIRPDTYGRYYSCLVYLPRDRYTTSVRERVAGILREELGGATIDYTARVTESLLARLHFVVRLPEGEVAGPVDVAGLETRLAEAARSWRDDFVAAVYAEHGEEQGARIARAWADGFPEAYKEDYAPRAGAADVATIEGITLDGAGHGLGLSFLQPVGSAPGEARLKVFRIGPPLSLSMMLPTLSSLGVEVVDERPYLLEERGSGHGTRSAWIYDFGLRFPGKVPDHARDLVQDAVSAVWQDRNEVDGFNALVLAAGLTWRQVTMLRAYAKYLRQGGTPFALDSIVQALLANVDIARLLVHLFEARFDPTADDLAADAESRTALIDDLRARIDRALEDVVSLDHDRILRSYLDVLGATLRTNYFRPVDDEPGGEPRPYLALKLRPSAIPGLPEPRPAYEIFVHSPRVEGVHLRFGAVARGGLRWSDRRDDFRTEVLGLVKAQMVKNAVIVPVGAKGGFYCKQLPDPGDRDAWLAEGRACYRTFISGLLDVTDNRLGGETVPPPYVVRHDEEDFYLVVAADKGTASFSDLANEVAHDYGFWLGDAFASGGSVGYDHKGMGITARGAWESVRRHFRERGVDSQAEEFTVVGIGDMSGDVFGNGLLRSEHARLVAAFDHRDIFLDPHPDPQASYAERRRLFDQPRSSWQDYDKALISDGGGVWSRSAKSIPISAQVREVLGLDDQVTAMAPNDLMRAILLAPVDLLWNGGIGTYVKASSESHADAGDKANDAIRVDGRDLRCAIVGEGGNLGFTQAGRIEYARAGGRINTDFIDNSAGVDTSDHEVNIKILLDRLVTDGDLTTKQRNQLLASMTDEVAELVLANNYQQNLALANAQAHAPDLLHVHEDWVRRLEREERIDRELEALPSTKEVARRRDAGEGLSAPELAVLLSYTKIVLAEELIDTDLPDDPFLRSELYRYFPQPMRTAYRAAMDAHPLRRQIVVTQVVNQLVNDAGITFFHRLSVETGAGAEELVRAHVVAREIFGARSLNEEIAAQDNLIDADLQTRMRLDVRTLVERATRWLVTHRRAPLDLEETTTEFEVVGERLVAALPDLLSGREQELFDLRRDDLVAHGVPEELAVRVAVLPAAYQVLGVLETAHRGDHDPVEVARVHFTLGERLGLPALVGRILDLPREDRWQSMARAALRDDLHGVHSQLTAQVLAHTDADLGAAERIARWEDHEEVAVQRAVSTLEEITADDVADLARLSVGLRVARTLLAAG